MHPSGQYEKAVAHEGHDVPNALEMQSEGLSSAVLERARAAVGAAGVAGERGAPQHRLSKRGTGLALLRQYLLNALASQTAIVEAERRRHAQNILDDDGDDEPAPPVTRAHYDYIKQQLGSGGAAQGKWLDGLTVCVSHIGEEHQDLMQVALSINIRTCPFEIFEKLGNLILNLVSANTKFLVPTMKVLVSQLVPDDDDEAAVQRFAKAVGRPVDSMPGWAGMHNPMMVRGVGCLGMLQAFLGPDTEGYDRLHEVIHGLLALVPASANALQQAISACFPHRVRPAHTQIIYVCNILRVASYSPICFNAILATIVDNMVLIDLEVDADILADEGEGVTGGTPTTGEAAQTHALARAQEYAAAVRMHSQGGAPGDPTSPSHPPSEADEADEEDEDDEDNDLYMMGINAMEMGDANIDYSEDEDLQTALSMAELMDTMLFVVLEFLSSRRAAGVSLEDQEAVFSVLLYVFDTSLIRTRKSKYTQFLLFHVCSGEDAFATSFEEYLYATATDPSAAEEARVAAACYLASFMARAVQRPLERIIQAVESVVTWLHMYVDLHQASFRWSEMRVHRVFYALCQAVFYLLCFHHSRMVMEGGDQGVAWMAELGLDRLINSKFNPLYACIETVVDEFARICMQHQLAYCYDIISKNARLHRERTVTNVDDDEAPDLLDTHFPFDPNLLRLSRGFIEPLYRHWVSASEAAPASSAHTHPSPSDPMPITRAPVHSSECSMSASPGTPTDLYFRAFAMPQQQQHTSRDAMRTSASVFVS